VSSFKNLQQLWTELKDGLALKMLAGLRQSAGLSPPLGLLALPAELKTKILASLQVLLYSLTPVSRRVRLASFACCCGAGCKTQFAGVVTAWRSLMTIVNLLANLVHTAVIGFADAG